MDGVFFILFILYFFYNFFIGLDNQQKLAKLECEHTKLKKQVKRLLEEGK